MRAHTRFAVTLVVGLTVAALAGPALAVAGQDLRSPDAADPVVVQQDLRSPDAADPVIARAAEPAAQDLRSPDAVDASTPATAETTVATASPGFDWASAAIGAGGAIGVIALAFGGTLMIRRRHDGLPSSLATR
jgi:hypothetical protein